MDPGVHCRVKGLRLVPADRIAAALAALQDITHSLSANAHERIHSGRKRLAELDVASGADG
jgi:hypothetical protein